MAGSMATRYPSSGGVPGIVANGASMSNPKVNSAGLSVAGVGLLVHRKRERPCSS